MTQDGRYELHLHHYDKTLMRETEPIHSEDRQRYVKIIDEILEHSDLTSISEKRVRKAVEAKIGKSLQEQKVRHAATQSYIIY